jgi:hypothetical protein
LTAATVPAIGARSAVWSYVFSALATPTWALMTEPLAAASAAAVGGACFVATEARAVLSESSSAATVCASRACVLWAVILAVASDCRSAAIFDSSVRIVFVSFCSAVSALWSALSLLLSCVIA